mgnify:CR=1 FL=1
MQEDEQLKKLVLINGAQKWSVVAEKIKVSPRTPHSTGPYSRSQLLQLTCRRMCAHCSAGTLRQELPFEVSIHTGAAALCWGALSCRTPAPKACGLCLQQLLHLQAHCKAIGLSLYYGGLLQLSATLR